MLNIIKLTFLLLCFSISAISQNDPNINQLDQEGQKHGIWINKYPNGNIRYKGTFKHGTPVDTFKRYHPNGNLMAIMDYSRDGKVYATLYNEKGEKRARGTYVDKKKDSTWVFFDDQGNLILQEHYKIGKRKGKSVKFFPNGDTSQIIAYRQGKKNGIFKQFFPNGRLKLLAQYKNGELDGYITFFSPNGYKAIEGLYRDNLREGKWVYYKDSSTDTSKIIQYKGGVPLNKDSLELEESKEIIRLENNQGKYGDPRQELMPSY